MADKKVITQQMGLRLDASLLQRMREYANAHPFKPSLTSLLNNAMREWLDRNEPADAKRKKG